MLQFGLIMLLSCLPLVNSQAASHRPQLFLQTIKGSHNEGEQIVQHFCATCHATNPMITLGAPRMENINDWAPRVKQGIKTLLAHTEEGFNAMPARGGCFECSDEQLALAIIALLPKKMRRVIQTHQKT